MAGVVLKTAADVKSFRIGDKVVNHPFRHWPAGKMNSNWIHTMVGGISVDGVLIEKLVYPAEALVKMPVHMTFEEGSTLTIAGLTAWAAVVTHGKTQPGEWVLVHGTGGVSIFAAQIAKLIGANVILTSSKEEKAQLVKDRIGIDATVNYKNEDWPKQVREITSGNGVDVVVDTGGGDILTKSILAAGYSSRIALIGNIADRSTSFKLFDVIRRQITLRGIFMESCEELTAFATACEASKLHPWIDKVFPFDEALDAFRHLESQNHIGKVVIKLK
jgi:NADPH:quinone reductase-like Zn-dependent oxidoreductase